MPRTGDFAGFSGCWGDLPTSDWGGVSWSRLWMVYSDFTARVLLVHEHLLSWTLGQWISGD